MNLPTRGAIVQHKESLRYMPVLGVDESAGYSRLIVAGPLDESGGTKRVRVVLSLKNLVTTVDGEVGVFFTPMSEDKVREIEAGLVEAQDGQALHPDLISRTGKRSYPSEDELRAIHTEANGKWHRAYKLIRSKGYSAGPKVYTRFRAL